MSNKVDTRTHVAVILSITPTGNNSMPSNSRVTQLTVVYSHSGMPSSKENLPVTETYSTDEYDNGKAE